ncbi:aminodeoxychorismate/anthranilate synthase component II [Virgibacillus sp. AGTR]|uniref:Aminodeoxychorismate/anthranilate synthase component II n=1 Tax=Virgibacillus salarius TaxID=447199 RepID=A0A941IA52_9BACI|nr:MULTISPECIES: aminodeoxychorismate/anthranilate synthase component II [Bacillaceae]NAZ07765.1 aminodeoxychorismate/anthranilate synthase component II [Agaribacter marinus]MBR7795047.1 aminodeoxychorismate/anthranilate synthase component II [Virgibacillus salarius]MCC2248448.1 aminodeoxychorismate/anthranilate synthase component II [Virgibacillus sp. AGTR]MDY7043117.1 aminodeoxychorismate/anthranilate synthase component II [Virgibacillus sp. M23]QRZ16687.1 aminodeoxychorismate/anthranilate s
MILVIDNYDSFTFNLVQYMKQLNQQVYVARNDEISIADIKRLNPSSILLSPGPGNPASAGICLEIVRKLYTLYPIIGICLGHQTIAQAFGASIVKAKQPMHGKVSMITHDHKGIFKKLKNPLAVTRYHSLIVQEATLPSCFEISAKSVTGEIMAIRHKTYPIEGIQAHPEAILSEQGLQLLENFFTRKVGQIDAFAKKTTPIL